MLKRIVVLGVVLGGLIHAAPASAQVLGLVAKGYVAAAPVAERAGLVDCVDVTCAVTVPVGDRQGRLHCWYHVSSSGGYSTSQGCQLAVDGATYSCGEHTYQAYEPGATTSRRLRCDVPGGEPLLVDYPPELSAALDGLAEAPYALPRPLSYVVGAVTGLVLR